MEDGHVEKGKGQTVERILAIEVEMFRSVPTDEEPECRRDLESFRLHRRAQFAGWSGATCASYLRDLEQARSSGRNLMTLKYARMDDRIPPLSRNPRIAWILQRAVGWQREVIARYPKLMKSARRLEDFSTYLAAELETYSDQTLALLAGDVESCQRAGENMSLAVYEALARAAGHASLEALEASLP